MSTFTITWRERNYGRQCKKLYLQNTITWRSEICLTSLIALFWNFPLMICNFPLLFSHSKNIRMSTLITIIITYELLIIVIIIITKSHFNYCSVGVMELCLLPLFIRRDLGTSQSVCWEKKISYHISYENIDQKHDILTFKFNIWIYVLFQSHIYNWYIDLFS